MLRYSISTFLKTLQRKALYSTSKPEKSTPLILKLMSEFDNISFITHALKNNELNSVNFEEWRSRMFVLKKYHFSDADCFKMISGYPYLLKIPLENFENTVKQWYQADLGLNNFQFLLLSQPQLVDVDVKEIRRRVPQLRVHFKSPEAFCNLLDASPNVMFDNWNAVIEKIHYLVKLNKFNMKDLIESGALSKSLNFIKFRLELLEKCGIYKLNNTPIHKLNRYDKTKHKNPTLKEILNSNTEAIAKSAKISVEEYIMCRDLFFEQEEMEEEEDEETGYNNY